MILSDEAIKFKVKISSFWDYILKTKGKQWMVVFNPFFFVGQNQESWRN